MGKADSKNGEKELFLQQFGDPSGLPKPTLHTSGTTHRIPGVEGETSRTSAHPVPSTAPQGRPVVWT